MHQAVDLFDLGPDRNGERIVGRAGRAVSVGRGDGEAGIACLGWDAGDLAAVFVQRQPIGQRALGHGIGVGRRAARRRDGLAVILARRAIRQSARVEAERGGCFSTPVLGAGSAVSDALCTSLSRRNELG